MDDSINTLNKSDLILQIERKCRDLDQEIVVDAIDLLLQEMVNCIALDKRLEIRGFGVFTKKTIRPRKFINPKNKTVSYVGETATMHFKSSDKLLSTHA